MGSHRARRDPRAQTGAAPLTTVTLTGGQTVEEAERVGASLIVIGLRRRTPVGKLILGSNAQRILLDASCPVLAVKS